MALLVAISAGGATGAIFWFAMKTATSVPPAVSWQWRFTAAIVMLSAGMGVWMFVKFRRG